MIANAYHNISIPLTEHLQWIASHPLTPPIRTTTHQSVDNEWSFTVRSNGQFVGAMLNYPFYCHLGKNLHKFVCFFCLQRSILDNGGIMFKESIRRAQLSDFNHGIVYFQSDSILKPFVTLIKYEFIFSYYNHVKLPGTPRTPGWRTMTSKDIPSALALTNNYTSQFEIGQVFQSEEEFAYYFMCPVIENYMHAYVVEDPVTGDITDVAGFKLEQSMDGRNLFAYATMLIPVESSARQLLIDLLVCAKQAKAGILHTFRFGIEKEVFKGLLSIESTICYWHFINYQYGEVDESEYCLFCY